jgi:signal transduction histidine kinase/CheY-like chemotaxis protein
MGAGVPLRVPAPKGGGVLTADVSGKDVDPVLDSAYLDALDTVLWIYDTDNKRVMWANRAALRVWNAETLEELRQRDLSIDMSRSVEQRLKQYQEDFVNHGATFREAWTIYPKGQPRMLRLAYRGYRLPDGRMAMLCEGTEEINATPEAMRSVEALLHTSVVISLFGIDGTMLYCNPAARACYGGGARHLDGRFADHAEAGRIRNMVRAEGMFEGAVAVTTLGGERWHQIRAFLCRDAVTGDQAMLFSETDVTETHLARLALMDSRNEAVEASRLKTEFVANMSHEIRTPLNGVLGLAQLMRNTALSPEQADLLTMIESSGKALLGIIEDILDISKIEAGEIALVREAFDLQTLVREALDTVFVAASSRGIGINLQMAADVPARVRGDPKRLRQVLINLLGNAIKFSRDADVDLCVEPHGTTLLRFSVIDRGVGIPPDQQGKVFERFRQVDGSLTRSHGGTGLGLAICKTLVELMGGQIGMTSVVGKGSTFWFTIASEPAEQTTEAESGVQDRSEVVVHLADVPILLAEDNPTNQFIIARSLERKGLDVDVVGNGAEALERLGDRSYGVVLMDIQMPVMSGFEAIQEIRKRTDAAARTPIIALTANATPEAMFSVLEVGADAYMTKPVKLDALYEKIIELLGRTQPRPEGGAPAALSPPASGG